MADVLVTIFFLLIGMPLLILCFDWIDDFRITKAAIKLLTTLVGGLSIKSNIYEVSLMGNSPQSRIVVKDGGVNVPVKCSEDVYHTILDMLTLNKDDSKVMIKAKINKRKLKLVSVQGYLIK